MFVDQYMERVKAEGAKIFSEYAVAAASKPRKPRAPTPPKTTQPRAVQRKAAERNAIMEKIRQCYTDGLSQADAKEQLEISISTIRRWCPDLDWPNRPPSHAHPAELKPEVIQEFYELFAAGYTQQQIADRTGHIVRTIKKHTPDLDWVAKDRSKSPTRQAAKEQVIKNIHALFDQGSTQGETADQLKISRNSVIRLCPDLKWPHRPKSRPHPCHIAPETAKLFRDMHARGHTQREISSMTGHTVQTVKRHTADLDWPRHPLNRPHSNELKPKVVEEIKARLRKGQTNIQIARELGVHRNTVSEKRRIGLTVLNTV